MVASLGKSRFIHCGCNGFSTVRLLYQALVSCIGSLLSQRIIYLELYQLKYRNEAMNIARKNCLCPPTRQQTAHPNWPNGGTKNKSNGIVNCRRGLCILPQDFHRKTFTTTPTSITHNRPRTHIIPRLRQGSTLKASIASYQPISYLQPRIIAVLSGP